MATTPSLLNRLSTIFSSRLRRSPGDPAGAAGASEIDPGRAPTQVSLRIQLLLILALAVSPVLILGGLGWSNEIAREANRRQQLMRLVADEAADRAERVLASAPALLDVIESLQPANDACDLQFSDLLELMPQFINFSIVGPNGTVLCSALPQAVGVTVGDVPWFQELRSTGATYVQSAAYVGPVTKVWLLASAKRRSAADGSFAGAFVVGVPISSLVFTLDRAGLPEGSEIALLDPSGRVFASAHWDALPPDVLQTLNPNGGTFHTIRTSSGDLRQAAIVPMSPGPLYAILSAPRPAPIAMENLSAFGNFALPLAAWLIALVAAWLAADRLVLRWIDYLRRIAALYASGKLTVQPLRARLKAPVEINMLADTLQDMAEKIRDRTNRLEGALEMRDAAMKEIHHRVKNNLQIINSLLSLQSRKLRDPSAVAVLDDARTRINALSLIHRSLYEHSDIRSVDVRSFLVELVSHLDQALGADDQKVRIESRVDPDTIDADMAVPLALFTAEAVTNAVKHAFPGSRGGTVIVTYLRRPGEAILTVDDDGVGCETPPQPQPGEAPQPSGLGSTLMKAFARQLNGVMEEGRSDSGGRSVRIRMARADTDLDEAVAIAS